MTLSSLINEYGRKGISDILRYYVKKYPSKRSTQDDMVLQIADDLQNALTNYQKGLEFDDDDELEDEDEGDE